jgi:uncharacterized protein YecT (DUF1311 family)
MEMSRSLCLFLLVIAFAPLHPKLAFASSGYAQFTLSKARAEAMDSRVYRTCLDQSGGVTASINGCLDGEYARLDRRLNLSYRATLRRLSQPKMMALRSDERLWVATRDEACLDTLKDEREGGGTIYSNLLRACRLEELKRRIVWVETRR